MATPIIGTASSRPATMNILVCSIGVSSGWRAEPSRNLPPRMAKPIAVPRAPRPIIRPAAMTVKLHDFCDEGDFSMVFSVLLVR